MSFQAALVATIAASSFAGAPSAHAAVVTCQGQAATVVGPTDGQHTTGTEGDDVIVAPLSANSWVLGLGGKDTICLVDGPVTSSRDPYVFVEAGAGDDSVTNQTTRLHSIRIQLGAGADQFVGAAYAEDVYGSTLDAAARDTEVDGFETGGGRDQIHSGSAGVGNHDVISTGTGRDTITYAGLAGGALDNGPDADVLELMDRWTGELLVDNVQRHASLASGPALTWTGIDGFGLRARAGSSITFLGSDASEGLRVTGPVVDLAAPTAISTGGGDDRVVLDGYLPREIATGKGDDSLTYLACHRAYVALANSAECLTADGRELSTALSGIEAFIGGTDNGITVQGTDRGEHIRADAKFVLVRSGPGADVVVVAGHRKAQVVGGRGDDRLKGFSVGGVLLRGGRGADVLRGDVGPDRLLGGPGRDVAWGQRGKDRCVTEVRHGCELA